MEIPAKIEVQFVGGPWNGRVVVEESPLVEELTVTTATAEQVDCTLYTLERERTPPAYVAQPAPRGR